MTLDHIIIDPIHYSPEAINNLGGKFMKYGKRHDTVVQFSLSTGSLGYESLYIKTGKMKNPKIVSPCWLMGCHDENGVKKIGFTFLYGSNGTEFHLYLTELIDILKQLGSTEMIKIWESQLKENNV